ncbi:TonB family protein [Pseudogemmobacter blasticus]|uniref:TonB C-terminal domain-containing protein n=1 Tax=Fuscovulum blasticum DSM 2131 TaxID=1188250 RepID=A0A2T4JAK4_FUSBL|nr:TonB family protein [Fuscovulum blasticum]PTE14940.1 hypothetical protein C5F44_06480 [Fuscovulum blasticum DSM 2131]
MTGLSKPAAALVALRGGALPAPRVPLGPVHGPVTTGKALAHLSPPGAAPALTAAPLPGPATPSPRAAPWSALVSAGLHAGAALALVATPVWLDAGAAGEAGLDSLSRPAPPAVQVTLMTPADLVPDLAPEVPAVAPDTLPESLTETAPEMPEVALAAETPPPPADAPLLRPDLPQADAPPADDGAFSAPPPPPKPVEKVADKPVEKKAKKKKRPAAPQPEAATKAAGTGGGAASGAAGKAADAGAGAASETDLKTAWGGKIRSRIEARKSTPRSAAGATGTVKVQLVVARSGKLLSASVVASSGHAALDQAALAAVRAAGRFPAAPKGLAKDSYSFTLPMRYN